MITFTRSADSDSINIDRYGKRIGYLHLNKKTAARIELIPAFAELTLSELEFILNYYNHSVFCKRSVSVNLLDVADSFFNGLSDLKIKTDGDNDVAGQLKTRQFAEWINSPLPKPNNRLVCIGCNKRLAVELEDANSFHDNFASIRSGKKPKRNYTGRWRYRSEGHFHSQSCATSWANKEIDKYLNQHKIKN
jgi:hypothetical protein